MASRIILTACTALLLAAGVKPSSATGLTIYDDPATFDAAVPNTTDITFTGDAAAGGYTEYTGGTTTQSGVTFTSNANLYAVSDTYGGGYYEFGTGVVLSFQQSTTSTDTLTITLPAATTAVALDFGAEAVTPFTFALSTGDSIVKTGGETTPEGGTGFAFIGFTSPIPFSTIVVSASSSVAPSVDNVMFAAIPEPSTLVLAVAAGGLIGVGYLRRRAGTAANAA